MKRGIQHPAEPEVKEIEMPNLPAPPRCPRHRGEHMYWTADPRLADGGSWRCRVKRAASRRRYDQSPPGQARYARFNEKRLDLPSAA